MLLRRNPLVRLPSLLPSINHFSRPLSQLRQFDESRPVKPYDSLLGTLNTETELDPAYFTGDPEFFKALKKASMLIKQFGEMPDQKTYNLNSVAKRSKNWLTEKEMSSRLNIGFTVGKYTKLTRMLNILQEMKDRHDSIPQFLEQFITPGANNDKYSAISLKPDEHGRMFAIASRKTAKAQVWLIEGDGQIYVNGKHMALYFPLEYLREQIVQPFEVSQTLGKFNVWALVGGGGVAGQAGAVTVAIARALMGHQKILDPKGLTALQAMTKIDRRQVERKKPGQPKARKKNTWVRR
ncbi:37S ribosomal protein S9, mitochondrial [Nowakowskiella sp. JEL0407]|nr:37S ribosomal protein S9, mitochondrial [Nowakowskiella sp. JEL0407]